VYNTNPPLHFCRTSFTCLDVLDEVSAERSGLTVSVTAISSPSKREQQNKQTRPQTRKEVSTNQQTLALTRETQEAKAKRDQVTALDNSQPTSRLRPHVHVQPEEHAPKESTGLAFTCTSAAAKQQSINQTQTEIRPHVHVQPEEHAPKESTGLAFTCTSAAAKQQSINQTQTETQTTRPSTLDPSSSSEAAKHQSNTDRDTPPRTRTARRARAERKYRPRLYLYLRSSEAAKHQSN
jgi:hypothetical protein